jgi:hypothetical protein
MRAAEADQATEAKHPPPPQVMAYPPDAEPEYY